MRATAGSGRRPLLVLGAAVTTAALALTGCAAGQHAQSAEVTTVVDGSGFQVGAIDLRDVGVRAPSGTAYAKGSTAFLEGVMINSGIDGDELMSVSSPDATSVAFYSDGVTALLATAPTASSTPSDTAGSTDTATPTGTGPATSTGSPGATTSAPAGPAPAPVQTLQSIPVDPNQAVQIGYQNSQIQIVLTGLTTSLAPSQTVPITFTFAKAGSVTVTINVKLITGASQSAPTIDTGKEGK